MAQLIAATVTDSERVIWTGPYRDFLTANLDALSVSELMTLEHDGLLRIGGGAAPILLVQLHPAGMPAPVCRSIDS